MLRNSTRLESAVRTKAFALIGLLFLGLVVLLLFVVPPADGYEMSIYEAYPWYFWAFVIGSFLVGQLVVLRSAMAGTDDDAWLVGVAFVMLTNAVLLFMPYIRGYPIYGRGDVLTHVGYVKNIAATGGIGSQNVYPNMHLLIQTLSYATGLDPGVLINLIPVVVSFVYFGSMFLLVVHLFEDRQKVLFGVAFVLLPLSSHLNAVPFVISILLVPFVLYLFVKEQQTNALAVRAALVIAIVAHVIYHPLTTLFLLGTFAIYHVAKRTRWFGQTHLGPTNVASLALVVFTAWYYNFTGMILRFQSVFGVLLATESGTSTFESYTGTVARTSPDLADLVRIAVFKYGLAALLVGLGILFLYVVFVLSRRRDYEMSIFTALFSAAFLLFSFGSVMFFVNDFIVGFGRPLIFGRVFNVVLVGALFYLLWRHIGVGWPRIGWSISMGVVLVLVVALTTYGVYPSPLVTDANHQVTEMELDGSKWVFENRNQDLYLDDFGITQTRMHHVHYGAYRETEGIRAANTTPPEHFNYTVNDYFGESYAADRYFFITRLGRITYQEKFPDYREHWRYTPADYDRLERDRTVTQVYTNGEFDVYLVDGINASAA
jgi:hypothetical protein